MIVMLHFCSALLLMLYFISDTIARVLSRPTFTSQQLNVSRLAPGIYFLTAMDQAGQLQQYRLVKQ